MKRGTPEHPKMLDLAEAIHGFLEDQGQPYTIETCESLAVGIIERLVHFTSRYAPAGNIGKYSNARIAKSVGWAFDCNWLIDSLLRLRWLDPTPGRLYLHDWHEHSDEYADRWLADEGLEYAVGVPPRNRPRPNSPAWMALQSPRDAATPSPDAGVPPSSPAGRALQSPRDTATPSAAELSVPSACDPPAGRVPLAGVPRAGRVLSEPEPEPEPESKPEPKTNKHASARADARVTYTEAFERWYREYPRKAGKHKAAAAFGRALPRVRACRGLDTNEAALEWLCEVTLAFAKSPKGQGEFVPYPATWLNEGRYDDDPAEWERSGSTQLTIPSIRNGPGQRYRG